MMRDSIDPRRAAAAYSADLDRDYRDLTAETRCYLAMIDEHRDGIVVDREITVPGGTARDFRGRPYRNA